MKNDLRYALRTLLRERGFSLTVVLSLAVGIGANTAIFSVVNGVLLRPLPLPEPERLAAVAEVVPKFVDRFPSIPANLNHFYEWRKRCTAFEQIAALRQGTLNLTGEGEPEQIQIARVSANTFRLLGVEPRMGRHFREEEDLSGRDRVVTISDSLWRRRFHADPDIIGRKILLDGNPYTVAAVLPADFRFPRDSGLGTAVGDKTEIFKPLGYTNDDLQEKTGDFNYATLARLRRGVTREQALAELNVVQAAILKDKADMFVSNARAFVLVDIGKRNPVQNYRARSRLVQSRAQAQQSRFAAARRTENRARRALL